MGDVFVGGSIDSVVVQLDSVAMRLDSLTIHLDTLVTVAVGDSSWLTPSLQVLAAIGGLAGGVTGILAVIFARKNMKEQFRHTREMLQEERRIQRRQVRMDHLRDLLERTLGNYTDLSKFVDKAYKKESLILTVQENYRTLAAIKSYLRTTNKEEAAIGNQADKIFIESAEYCGLVQKNSIQDDDGAFRSTIKSNDDHKVHGEVIEFGTLISELADKWSEEDGLDY